MTYNMPLSKQNKSTKDAVISVLAEKWPLTAKEIYNRVKRESNTTVSYQAIHKLLNQLIEEKIIVKEGMGYLLNKDWIKNLKNFSSSLEELYLKNFGANALKELEEHGTINITVNGILETAKFIIGGLANLPNAGKKPNIFLWRNVYSVIGLAESDYAGIQKTFSENKWFAVASENNLLDRMFADTLEKYGVKKEYIQPFEMPALEEVEEKKIKCTWMSFFKKWVPQENFYFAVENTGFQPNPERTEGTYSKYASIDDKFDGFHFYFAFLKFGIGRATSDAAHEIRDKHITREEGIALVKKYDGEFPKKYFQEFLEFIDVPENKFLEIADKFRNTWLWEKKDGAWRLKNQIK